MKKSERLAVETKTQTQFREEMEEHGFEIRTYSGRGMYGRETYGVVCSDRYGTELPHEHDVIRATELRLRTDSMGLDVILYVE